MPKRRPPAEPPAHAARALKEYRRKRDFTQSAEPSGDRHAATSGQSFVVQKHEASHLHYDFRLELDGVLKSWAVAKGPSVDPAVKRLAVETEDHPLTYGDFEGTIPKGQYGGGTVMVWDQGTWEPTEDPRQGFKAGRLKFALHGEKMKGLWALVRMKRRPQDRRPNWLLIKDKDPAAVPGDPDKLLRRDKSAKTARSMTAIAAGKDVWRSNRTDQVAKPKKRPSPSGHAKAAGLRRRSLSPRSSRLVWTRPPQGDDWLHEIKFDGYRLLVRVHDGDVRILTRHEKDWTDKFTDLAAALQDIAATSAYIDGEAVIFDENGMSDFGALQTWFKAPAGRAVTFCAFDLLHLDGKDLRGEPLTARKAALQTLLDGSALPAVKYSDHQEGGGEAFFAAAKGLGVEGIISKRADAPYTSGRTQGWLKIKRIERQEFVIGGYIPSAKSPKAVGALLMGECRGGKLSYVGKVGTGYTQASARELFAKLSKRASKAAPFESVPAEARRGAVWAKPQLVAEVEFGAWTADRILRHAAFIALREDKTARDVKPERVLPVKKVTAEDNAVRGITVTHPERVIYAAEKITKLDVARYYEAVADVMLPHIAERPLSLVRCPDGVGPACFFQKHVGAGLPESIREERISAKDRVIVLHSAEGLISLVQRGVLEIHCWGSHLDTVEQPDLLVFDFDPDTAVQWKAVVAAAVTMRGELKALGLKSFVKTTGGKGLHVVVPLTPGLEWDGIKQFSRAVADRFAARDPKRYLVNMAMKLRKGRIFVDYLRNGRGATAVAPYSTRARPGGRIATPVSWDELEGGAKPADFTIASVPKRILGRFKDPWRDINTLRQSITAKMIETLIDQN